MARITQNRRITLFSLWPFNQSEARKKRMQKYLFNKKKNILYDSQSIIKSTHISYIWIIEIIQIVVFHLVFGSIQISVFLNNFWNSVPNSRSNIRQTLLSGTGFLERMVQLKKTILRAYSHIFRWSENFIHMGWAFVLNKFEYCRRDTLLEPLIYWQPVQFVEMFI